MPQPHAHAQGQTRTPSPERRRVRAPSPSTRPIRREDFGYDQARHLLWRAGFGGTPAQVRAVSEMGPRDAVDFLLDFESTRDTYDGPSAADFNPFIMAEPTPEQRRAYQRARREQDEDALARLRRTRQDRQRSDRRQVADVKRWWLERMIESPRPLEEKLTLFWHGHFATGYRTIENSYHMYLQNQLFRAHAAGSFESLMRGIIRDPAMLNYLNNDRNRVGAPNENLARELMELFSLGEGNYSERDIKEGARALTGYTFRNNEFVFNADRHDTGSKRILAAQGNLDGDDFVTAILHERSCSEFIAMKLYEFFVAMVPSDRRNIRYRPAVAFIESIAKTMREHDYELKPVLREMFRSRHFYEEANIAEKIKSPVELVVSSVRSLRVPVRDLDVLVEALSVMGQEPLQPPNVAGWPGGRSWINTSTLFVRQNILAYMLTGKLPSGFDPDAAVERYDATPMADDLAAGEIDGLSDPVLALPHLCRFMLGRPALPRQLDVLTAYVDTRGGRLDPPTLSGCMALITAMPEYQLG
ncbi:MAG: DUF1800 domain-containing protein [Planctomycetota bacterium]